MFLVGLTGGIASGKSTVAAIFANHGFPIVDADVVSRKVVEPGRKAWRELKKYFGDEIFHEDGTLNRERLAEIIFSDRDKRRRLNEITHPEIIWEMILQAIWLGIQGHSCVVMDIPLLYESGELVRFMHKIIVVRCEGTQQVERLLARTRMTRAQAELRVASQMPLDQKAERADLVVDNSKDVDSTKRLVESIIVDLRRSRFHYKIRFYIFLAVSVSTIAIGFFLRFIYNTLYP